jgi:hypothetical protein
VTIAKGPEDDRSVLRSDGESLTLFDVPALSGI